MRQTAKAVAQSELWLHCVSLNPVAFGHCKCCMEQLSQKKKNERKLPHRELFE